MRTSMYKHSQKGAALVVGLIVLLIMTLLGVTSMSLTTTELKASGNMQTHNLAMQAAETATSVLMDENSVVSWIATTPQSFLHGQFYPNGSNTSVDITSVAGGSLDVTANVIYQNCSKVPMGYSLTETGQDGESLMNANVHDLDVNATVQSTLGTQIGASRRLRGVETMVVKCDKI